MAQYLVEAYAPRAGSNDPALGVARLQAAAEELTAEGVRVQYVRSIVVPDDEICFHVLEGPSADAIGELGRRAGLTFDRVTEAVEPVAADGGVS
jgi:hypothetical protein